KIDRAHRLVMAVHPEQRKGVLELNPHRLHNVTDTIHGGRCGPSLDGAGLVVHCLDCEKAVGAVHGYQLPEPAPPQVAPVMTADAVSSRRSAPNCATALMATELVWNIDTISAGLPVLASCASSASSISTTALVLASISIG